MAGGLDQSFTKRRHSSFWPNYLNWVVRKGQKLGHGEAHLQKYISVVVLTILGGEFIE